MVLSCQNVSKSFGTEEVLRGVGFGLEPGEKAAIVGANGAGKSTLLKVIVREEEPDSGEVVIAKGATIGYLAQYQDESGGLGIYDEVLSARADLLEAEGRLRRMEEEMDERRGDALTALLDEYHRLSGEFKLSGGETFRSEAAGILKGLGFSEDSFSRKMSELSGGQKTRVSLGRLLASRPDVLILDEPTNHLDVESIAWLETFLSNYRGAVLLVAHDRYFLDRVVTKIVEIEGHESRVYSGNYTDFAKKKALIREEQRKRYYNQQRDIKRQEEVIERLKSFNREKSIRRAESREKMLARVERVERPSDGPGEMRISFTPGVTSGKDVLSVSNLAKSYGERELFSDLSLDIRRGERVALIGGNGTGKTTILKIINGLIDADQGSVTLGANVNIGYYDQEHQLLHMEKTLFEEISDEYPSMDNTQIRNALAAFLFTGDDAFKLVSDISGGERGRISLAKLMLSDANFLILDEPTNHLDITSKEILEDALRGYEGTVLFVSHDRYFINRAATRILELSGGELTEYLGDYDYYLEKRAERGAKGDANAALAQGGGRIGASASGAMAGAAGASSQGASSAQGSRGASAASGGNPGAGATGGSKGAKEEWLSQKSENARIRKLENDLGKTEGRIEELESRIAELDEEMSRPEVATNSARLGEIAKEQEECRRELSEKMEEWETLSLALEG